MYGSKQKEYIVLFIQCQLPARYTMRNEAKSGLFCEETMRNACFKIISHSLSY
ncbi:hypothetical protein BACOVA_05217 [Bacteroides ovatus ATCC 8483]|uniref:Uncharacterized protein n=1 Tax=Bacteroides ovatus (strain ATCC 8483 / DSM 1896 / JCM 5824 / BCRC 10623 / CCUG 4943 / NCTC 11153) TaxID=411476 RepID=A0AAN3A3Q4_BACO1|nr:hypothetical protein BACOVA_05217 [Bacteroides ovatus ATCC 8483]